MGRWFPYVVLGALVIVGAWMPHTAMFVLAIIHFAALNTIHSRSDPAIGEPTWRDRLGASIADQITSVETGHMFSGDAVRVTSTAQYTGLGRTFVVTIARKAETETAA